MKTKVSAITGFLFLTVMMLAVALPAGAAEKYTGKVGGKYPVVVYLTTNGNRITGKYAYSSTLKKNGNQASSWLYITGTTEGYGAKGATFECVVKDSAGKMVEHWTLDYYSWGVSATITTARGKVYTLNLH